MFFRIQERGHKYLKNYQDMKVEKFTGMEILPYTRNIKRLTCLTCLAELAEIVISSTKVSRKLLD